MRYNRWKNAKAPLSWW